MTVRLHFILLSSIVIQGLLTAPVLAQDVTGVLGTTVDMTGGTYQIEGGHQHGVNLFHSFDHFSPSMMPVVFDNLSTVPMTAIERIFVRVLNSGTGSVINNTIGLLDDSLPADIFIIDPQGITFGHNAGLGSGVSLISSTAETIRFADGSEFSALDSTTPSPLTVSIPTALNFVNTASGITLQGAGHNIAPGFFPNSLETGTPTTSLTVDNGRSITLVGGDVTLDGANLLAPQGQINVGSVGTNSTIALEGNTLIPNYDGVTNFGEITLSNLASLDASGDGGGQIQVQGRQISLDDGSLIFSNTTDTIDGQDITVIATGSLNINGTNTMGDVPSGVIAQTNAFGLGGGVGGAGGNVQITTPSLSLDNGGQIAATTYEEGGAGGGLIINAPIINIQGISPGLSGPTGFFTDAGGGSSPSGDITITTEQLTVDNGAAISATASFDAIAGDIQITNAQEITITGTNSQISASTFGSGDAGSILLDSAQITLREGGRLLVSTDDDGNAGTVNVNGEQLTVLSGSEVAANTFAAGAAGRIQITVDDLRVDGVGDSASRISSSVGSKMSTTATGSGGEVLVRANTVQLSNGGQLLASTFAPGDGGRIQVDVSESIEIMGFGNTNADGQAPSSIATQVASSATGHAGQIEVNTPRLQIRDGGAVTAGTGGQGSGGSLMINATDSIEITGSSNSPTTGIGTRTLTAANAGNLSITTNTLQISDQGTVTVESLGIGNAGNLDIDARYIRLDNNASITGATDSGQGGNLDLDAMHIVMLFDSEISTTAGSANLPGDGGNITIAAATVTGLFNSDIAANSFQGRGGRIVITAEGIFGLEFRLARTSGNDITAFSRIDPQLNGDVVINTPDIDPTQALIEVPVVESPEVVRRVCGVGVGDANASFEGDGTLTVQGSGLPSSPTDAPGVGRILLRELDVLGGSDRPTNPTNLQILPPPQRSARDRLIAQGVGRNAQGQWALTAQTPTPTGQSVFISAVRC
ncbi:MAG: hypothetical protein AAGG51_14060 [Cyanobacteria bacterium P01_G01_bin.54]